MIDAILDALRPNDDQNLSESIRMYQNVEFLGTLTNKSEIPPFLLVSPWSSAENFQMTFAAPGAAKHAAGCDQTGRLA